MKGYVAMHPRPMNGQWVNGFIKKNGKEAVHKEAFEFLCAEMRKGNQIEAAREETKKRFCVDIEITQYPQPKFSRPTPRFEVLIG